MSAAIKVLDQQGRSKAKKAAMIGKLLMSLLLNRIFFNRDGLEGFGGLKK